MLANLGSRPWAKMGNQSRTTLALSQQFHHRYDEGIEAPRNVAGRRGPGSTLSGLLRIDFGVAKRTRRGQYFAGALVDLGEKRGVEPVDRVAQPDREADLDDLLLGEMLS
jgi:hypothetical protein